jgi:diguanylate cyclase (GGDEF)-like protein
MPATVSDLSITAVRGVSRIVLDEEEGLLRQRRVDTEHTSTLTQVLTATAIVLSLIFLAVAEILVAAALRRARRSNENLRETNAQLGDALSETRQITESMHKLSQLGEMLQSCRELDELRTGLGGAMADLLPDLGGRLALINPSQNLAIIGAHWGRHGLLAESIFQPEDCWALRRGQAYPLAGTSAGFVCKHVHWPSEDHPEAGYLCVPLAAQGEVVGVLTFDGERAPTAGERRIALAAGEQLALALANLRLQETLRTQSIRDPLTGLFNRRYLEASLELELLRAARRSLPLAVLMLDIDHFKRFNDSHGHEAGDALLSKFAEVLRRTIRNDDIACRFGGEEFTILLLEADADAAMQRAEQIREAVAAMSVEHRRGQLPHVTTSIGCAIHPRDGRTAEELLRRADAALYHAKRSGRDRVALAAGEATEVAG